MLKQPLVIWLAAGMPPTRQLLCESVCESTTVYLTLILAPLTPETEPVAAEPSFAVPTTASPLSIEWSDDESVTLAVDFELPPFV